MKRLATLTLLLAFSSAFADVTPTTITVTTPQVVTTVTTNTVTFTNAVVGSSVTITFPPDATQAVYTVTCALYDKTTKREIPRTRKFGYLKQAEVMKLSSDAGVDFQALSAGIEGFINEYRKSVFSTSVK